MYITNPTKEMLDNCFRCSGYFARYLMTAGKMPLFHRNGDTFYFVKTDAFDDVMQNVPPLIGILKNIL